MLFKTRFLRSNLAYHMGPDMLPLSSEEFLGKIKKHTIETSIEITEVENPITGEYDYPVKVNYK